MSLSVSIPKQFAMSGKTIDRDVCNPMDPIPQSVGIRRVWPVWVTCVVISLIIGSAIFFPILFTCTLEDADDIVSIGAHNPSSPPLLQVPVFWQFRPGVTSNHSKDQIPSLVSRIGYARAKTPIVSKIKRANLFLSHHTRICHRTSPVSVAQLRWLC